MTLATATDLQDAYPLSQLQLGMLYHSELVPGASVYHDVCSLHLEAPFDRAALQAALDDLVERHQILRTSFELAAFEEPLQLVHCHADLPLRVEDLRDLGPREREGAIASWLEVERHVPFDLRRPPLLRAVAHQRFTGSFQLSLSFHHAILDGWSLATFLSELLQRYAARIGLPVPPLPPAPASLVSDFVRLEREALASEAARRSWAAVMADAPLCAVPRLREAPLTPRAPSAPTVAEIDPQALERLRGLAAGLRVPLRSLLLAAHVRVTAMLAGSADVVTGLVTHGRPEARDGERLLGLFLNTVPFRLRLAGGTWAGLATEVFAQERRLLPYRRYPGGQILRDAGTRQPPYETLFDFRHFHVYRRLEHLPGIRVLDTWFVEETNFPLTVSCNLERSAGRLRLVLRGRQEDLAESQVREVAGWYRAALDALAADAAGRYHDRSLLYPEEERRLVHGFNPTAAASATGALVHELVERQAARTPAAVAVAFQDQQVTYAELVRRVRKLADRLAAAGVAGGPPVGVCLPRSVELVVALLAVLRAGGTYLPLDPSFPRRRLEGTLRHAEAGLVLTTRAFAAGLADAAARVVCLDDPAGWDGAPDRQEDAPDGRAAAPTRPDPSHLAYVIHTSGSTGRPKGVMVPHSALANFLAAMRRRPGLDERDVLLSVTSPSFDIFALEAFLPLVAGARLVLVPDEVPADGLLLRRQLERNRVTTLQAVPSTWRLLVEAGWSGGELRRALCGGEALPADLAEQIAERVDELWNLYGPTETTIWSSAERLDGRGRVTIGRPIANTRLYVLDRWLHPAPVGVPGELYIAGAGLARGYLRRPALTAERFLPDPFSPQPGGRMYATGDLARRLPDGRVEYLGRLDQQVKIRGYRVELGEIEQALDRHPQVRQSAAAVVPRPGGEPRLVAYVVAPDGQPPSPEQLRAFLADRLPRYMLPGAFVVLPRLPLMPNGKLDRKALPAPAGDLPGRPSGASPPRDELERRLVGIWKEVLGVAPIGSADHFLELGGDSLTGLRLMMRIRAATGQELPVSLLFEQGTVASLAQALRGAGPAHDSLLVRFRTTGRARPFFCVHPLGGHVFGFVLLSQHLGPDQPFNAIRARGLEASEQPFERVEEMAACYVEAVRRVQPSGPYRLGGWCMGGTVAYEMAGQLAAAGERLDPVAIISSRLHEPNLARLAASEDLLLLDVLGRDIELGPDDLPDGPFEAKLAYVFQRAQHEKALRPDVVDLDHAQRLLRTYKAHVKALLGYRPGRYEGPVLVIRPADATGGDPPPHTLGWDQVVTGPLEVAVVPGTHNSMLGKAHVAMVARRLAAAFAAAAR